MVEPHRDRLEIILGAARRRYTMPVLRWGDRMSRYWAARKAVPYLDELTTVASAVGSGGWMLNFSYEWGCTAGAAVDPSGEPRLLRCLDWSLPGLGLGAIVARCAGPAGTWLNLTWPGFVGVVQGVARGRFAATINQAPSVNTGLGRIGDWVNDKLAFWSSPGIPPVLLLRQVFDQAHDFADALRRLTEAPVCSPVLFSLVGTRPDEAAVIERTEAKAVVTTGRLAVSNHWLSPGMPGTSRSVRTVERLAAMRAHLAERRGRVPVFDWVQAPILNDTTRLAMEAVPATGEFWARGFEPNGAVTEPVRFEA